MVRTYELIYLDALVGQDLPLNNVSLLKQVKVIGHDENDETEELPPLEFGYTQFNPEGRKFFPLPVANLPTGALDNPDIELADLFGNGMPDILQMNGTVRYWRNRGNGQFDPPRPMSQAPAGVRLADTGVQMLDANGDGRIDLMVTSEVIAGYYGTRPEGLWERRAFQRFIQSG